MKAAAYDGVEGLINYDLKNSQLHCLVQELEYAGLNTDWLLDYLSTSNAKEVYAKSVGISAEGWKRCLLALAMGAHLPMRVKEYEQRENRILNSLAEEAGSDLAAMQTLLERLIGIVGPMNDQLKKWHKWLLTDYNVRTYGRGSAYISNKCEKKLKVRDLPKGRNEWQARSRVAAFLLQGREAAFIHYLTLLGEKYGYKPIANEHDGLVVIGEIPNSAVEEAARFSDFQNATLVKKEFVEVAIPEIKAA
jgi:hypothetical protein